MSESFEKWGTVRLCEHLKGAGGAPGTGVAVLRLLKLDAELARPLRGIYQIALAGKCLKSRVLRESVDVEELGDDLEALAVTLEQILRPEEV